MNHSATFPETRRFRTISSDYLKRTYELFPEYGSSLGLHEYDAELGENTQRVHAAYSELLQKTLEAVEALPAPAFTGDDWLDRRGFLAQLRTEILLHTDLKRWRNNPQQHCDGAMGVIFELVVRNTSNLRKALPAIESRLSKLPAYLEAGADCLREPVPLWSKLAVQSCDGAVEFLGKLEDVLAAISPDEVRTRRLFAGAVEAFRRYARVVKQKKPGRADGYSLGRERFELMIRERLGLSLSLPEAQAMGRRLVEQLTQQQKAEAAKFGKKKASEIIEAAAEKWSPRSGSLFEEYETVTLQMRDRFAKADLLTLPEGETLKVTPVPEFLRHQFPTAAYDQPPAFSKNQEGIFWVNDLSLLQKTPEKKQAEVRQHFGIELTCAHEAYPGHHVQFVIQNRHPSKLRRLFHHAVYYEGWTLWCERMCIEHGIYRAPHAKLVQTTDALWRAWRIIIDCGLHSGELDYKGACDLLMKGVGFTQGRAQGDVNWYTSSPTVPMSYLIGRLELEKLHAKLVTQGGWPLKKFNDWVLGFGALPWSWIWESALTSQNLSIARPRG